MFEPKQSIRPEIPGLEPAATPAESFQNEVLRPILKMQHALLVSIFVNYLQRKKVPLAKWTENEQLAWIENGLKKDQRLRQLLLGTIIGHFTLDEWEQYQTQESELARRIIQMLNQRLQSARDQLLSLID